MCDIVQYVIPLVGVLWFLLVCLYVCLNYIVIFNLYVQVL